MATSEILLVKPVDGLGNEGDEVKVKAGYARNFLLPRKFAVPVTKSNRKQVEALKRARDVREQRELEGAQALAARLEALHIAIAVKTGEGGRMFGAVTASPLATANSQFAELSATGHRRSETSTARRVQPPGASSTHRLGKDSSSGCAGQHDAGTGQAGFVLRPHAVAN